MRAGAITGYKLRRLFAAPSPDMLPAGRVPRRGAPPEIAYWNAYALCQGVGFPEVSPRVPVPFRPFLSKTLRLRSRASSAKSLENLEFAAVAQW